MVTKESKESKGFKASVYRVQWDQRVLRPLSLVLKVQQVQQVQQALKVQQVQQVQQALKVQPVPRVQHPLLLALRVQQAPKVPLVRRD